MALFGLEAGAWQWSMVSERQTNGSSTLAHGELANSWILIDVSHLAK
jgi:hypothetical protein